MQVKMKHIYAFYICKDMVWIIPSVSLKSCIYKSKYKI